MPAFRYRALNPQGKLIKGVLEGDSERQIRGQLRARTLRPVSVVAVTQQAANAPRFELKWFKPRV